MRIFRCILVCLFLAVTLLAGGNVTWAFQWDPPAPASTGATGSGAASAPINPADQQKLTDLQAKLDAGQFDEVIDAARAITRVSKDEGAKTEAMRLIAEALRKKGDWKQAPGAYQRLRDRFPKGFDDYAKYDGYTEIFRSAPNGVYLGGGAGAKANNSANVVSKTLADDVTLAEALNRVAEARLEKLKSRLALIKNARTPQEVVALLSPLVTEMRQIHMISAAAAAAPEHGMIQSSATQLADLEKKVSAAMTAKQAEFNLAIQQKRFSSAHHKDMDACIAQCTAMAKAESAFQAEIDKVPGAAEWTDCKSLHDDSAARQAKYTQLVGGFVPPPPPPKTPSNW